MTAQHTEIVARIREAGGIVHSDGNIFFTNVDQFLAASLAAQQEEVARLRMKLSKTPDWHDLLSQLVEALDDAFISSWQSTARWQKQLDQARDALNPNQGAK